MLLAVAPMPTGTTATLTLTGATPLYTFGAVALTGVTPTYYAVAGALANSVTIDTPASGALVAASIKAPTGTVAWGGALPKTSTIPPFRVPWVSRWRIWCLPPRVRPLSRQRGQCRNGDRFSRMF